MTPRSCEQGAAIGRARVPERDERLRRHLEECPRCRADRAADVRVAALARELPVATPDPDRMAAIRGSLLAPEGRRRRRGARWPRMIAYGIATACAASVAAAVTTRFLDRDAGHQPPPAPPLAVHRPARVIPPRQEPSPSPPAPVQRRVASVAPPAPVRAHPRAATPAQVAFARGWEAMRAGDDAGAAAAFDLADRLAGHETIAEDALYWRAIALARLGRESAPGAMEEYLSRHGAAPRAREISAMLGWLLVERGDCAGAEPRFRAAADDVTPAVRDSARAGLAALARCRRP
jgi:hypothetical protein